MLESNWNCELAIAPQHEEIANRAASRLRTTHPHVSIKLYATRGIFSGLPAADLRLLWKAALLSELEYVRSEPSRAALYQALFS